MLPIYVTADEGHAAYLGTAEDIAAIEAFGREYQFAGPVEDADFAADSVLADLRRDGDIDPTAEAKLRAALIVCAVRHHGARRTPWGPGDPEYDALHEPFPGVEGGVFMPGARGLA